MGWKGVYYVCKEKTAKFMYNGRDEPLKTELTSMAVDSMTPKHSAAERAEFRKSAAAILEKSFSISGTRQCWEDAFVSSMEIHMAATSTSTSLELKRPN